MPLNSAMFWKVRAMPALAAACAVHAACGSRRGRRSALLRVVDAVDDVEHRALAGAVRADDGADLVLAHVEADVGQRLDAAERSEMFSRSRSTSPMRLRAVPAGSCRALSLCIVGDRFTPLSHARIGLGTVGSSRRR